MAYMSKFKTKNQGNVPIGSNLFGTCSTASGTAAKVVALSDFNVLTEGVTVHVYFTNANTASNPTLQVGSTASTPISGGGTWKAGRVVSFTYHGGIWVQNDYQDGSLYGLSFNNGTLELVEDGGSQSVSIPDTTYEAGTAALINAGTDTANRVWSAKILHDYVSGSLTDIFYPVGSYYETSDADFNPNDAWGGTWVKEIEGQVHVSAGTNYPVSGATQASGAGVSDGGNKDAIVPYHRHSVSAFNTGGMSANEFHTHNAGAEEAFLRYNQLTVGLGVQERSVASGASGNYKAPVVNDANVDWSYIRNTGSTGIPHTHQVGAHNTNWEGTDGNTTNANMQPYIKVYRWHRTA